MPAMFRIKLKMVAALIKIIKSSSNKRLPSLCPKGSKKKWILLAMKSKSLKEVHNKLELLKAKLKY